MTHNYKTRDLLSEFWLQTAIPACTVISLGKNILFFVIKYDDLSFNFNVNSTFKKLKKNILIIVLYNQFILTFKTSTIYDRFHCYTTFEFLLNLRFGFGLLSIKTMLLY